MQDRQNAMETHRQIYSVIANIQTQLSEEHAEGTAEHQKIVQSVANVQRNLAEHIDDVPKTIKKAQDEALQLLEEKHHAAKKQGL